MSAGISRVNVDVAGGLITGNLVPSVTVNGAPIAVVGAAIAPHGTGVHANAVTQGSSATVFAGGLAVCRQGDAASCGHIDTGSSDVTAG